MLPSVSTADVEARWRPLSDAESVVAATLIDDLVNDLGLLRPALADTLGDLAAGTTAEQTKGVALERVIVAVFANAIKRALRNPDTLRSTNIGADGGIGVGYDNSADALDATRASLTRADLADIDKATAAADGIITVGVGSVRLQAYPERYVAPNLSALPTP